MNECIEREAAILEIQRHGVGCFDEEDFTPEQAERFVIGRLKSIPAADVVEIPATGIGDLSDGYHTFNGLYYQRMILFATLVKQNKDKSWKSYRHEDGELCFGGGWFIAGIDTPEGSYTYHYENKDFDLFDCVELPVGKHWDGHTEADVTRLLSLPAAGVREVVNAAWNRVDYKPCGHDYICSNCGDKNDRASSYCPNCGCLMEEQK